MMDALDGLLFFLGGIVVGVLGLVAYKGAFNLYHSNMGEAWMREQRRMQARDDRRI